MRTKTLVDEHPGDELAGADAFGRFARALDAVTGTPRLRLRLRSVVARSFGPKVIVTVVFQDGAGEAQDVTVRLSKRQAETIYAQLKAALKK